MLCMCTMRIPGSPHSYALSPSKAGKPMFKELDGSTAGSTSGGTEVQVTEVQVTEPKV